MAPRWLAAATSVAALAMIAACSTASPEPAEPSSDGSDSAAPGDTGQVQDITFWHAMSGKNGETLQGIVDDFNASQDGVHVEAVFQGKYNEVLTKLKASIPSNQSPTLVQVFEIGTQIMIDTGATVPFAETAAAHDLDLSDMDPAIAAYFTVDGELKALPFNTSVPLLYLNKDALREAGLEGSAPQTWGEVLDLAEKLTVRNGSETTRYGMVLPVEGWFVEQMLAAGGQDYCDASNGRDGRATTVQWTDGPVDGIVSGWAEGVAEGSILNVGRNNSDAAAAFQAGRAAMIPFTSANLRDMIRESDFEVEAIDFVRPDGTSRAGVFNGGAALWLMDSATEEERAAAAEFERYLMTADVQGLWAAQTGYVPLNTKSAESAAFTEVLAEFPAFSVAPKQLGASTGTGCLMGTMPQARNAMNDAIEAAVNGTTDAPAAIAAAQESMVQIIGAYNAAVN